MTTKRDKVYWVVQRRTKFFGIWKPELLFKTRNAAEVYQSYQGGGPNLKVDRVVLSDG